MAEKFKIYKYEEHLERKLRKFQDSDSIQTNKQLILDFHRQTIAEGLGAARQIKIIHVLDVFSKRIAKPFDDLIKNDVVDLVGFVETQKWSPWTKLGYKVILKKFFKWLKNTRDYPDEVSWIKTSLPKSTLLPNHILTEEEIKKLVEAATNPRDKAFIFTLYESGCRIGEILTLKIKDVEFDEYGAFLNVTGKTGPRLVRIIHSVPLLALWLNCHQFSRDLEAPLWVKLNNPEMEFMTPATVRSFLKKVVKKAGIKKKVYPHLFRHSRATHLASQIPESLLKKFMGWVPTSDMAATYVHLSELELDNALLKASGIHIGEKQKSDKLQVMVCPRCTNANGSGSKYCFACGFCFDITIAVKVDETREKVNKLLDALVKNPEKLESLVNLIQSQ